MKKQRAKVDLDKLKSIKENILTALVEQKSDVLKEAHDKLNEIIEREEEIMDIKADHHAAGGYISYVEAREIVGNDIIY